LINLFEVCCFERKEENDFWNLIFFCCFSKIK
jgi:hypothetical protein